MFERGYGNYRLGFRLPRGCAVLMAVTCAVFILQTAMDMMTDGAFTRDWFGLSLHGLARLRIWQLVTYMFLHGSSIFHIIFNMLGLYVFGREIEEMIGTGRFVFLYLCCGVCGGLLWLALGGAAEVCIGASGGVLGLLGTFAAFFPGRRITLLLFLVVPVTLTARMLAAGYAVISVFSLFTGHNPNVAHLAHLGGGLAGYIYGFRTKRARGFLFGTEWTEWNPFSVRWFRQLRSAVRRRKFRLLDPEPDYVPGRNEIDGILEKISGRGMDSLSRWEKAVLDRAGRNGVRPD